MKILFIHDVGHEKGGAETVLFDTLRELKRRGHDVRLLSAANPINAPFNDYSFRVQDGNYFEKALFYLYNPFAYQALKQILTKYRPDLVHVHTFTKASPSIFSLLKSYPTIITLHDYGCIYPLLHHVVSAKYVCNFSSGACCLHHIGIRYYWELIRVLIVKQRMQRVGSLMPNSLFMADVLRNLGFQNVSNITWIGKSLFAYSSPARNADLLYVGRLEVEKGVHCLINAMPSILDRISSVQLTILGNGTQLPKLKELVESLRLSKKVTFVGYVTNPNLETYYRKARIVVVPSLWAEPFGLVGIEAMSVGRPVIGSNVGGIPEWLAHRQTGMLVEPGEVNAIAQAAIELLCDEQLYFRLSNNGVIKSKQYTLEHYVDALEHEYRTLIRTI